MFCACGGRHAKKCLSSISLSLIWLQKTVDLDGSNVRVPKVLPRAPPPDAQAHFEELLAATALYRTCPPHAYAAYSGPWIENHWIANFSGRDMSAFGGLVPLFVQWVDCFVQVGRTNRTVWLAFRRVHRDCILPVVQQGMHHVS